MGVAILKGEFAQLSAEYNEKFGTKPPSAEQAALLERVGHVTERAIDAYARAVALSTRPEQREAKAKYWLSLRSCTKTFTTTQTPA
jgi:predicted RNA polymerase sigma factor